MSYGFSNEQWEYIYKLGYPGEWDKSSLVSEAIYRGGEGIVKKNLLNNEYMPVNVEEIIEEGMKSLLNKVIHLQTASDIEKKIFQSLADKTGFSLIRLGDGEIIALAHDILISSDEINKSAKLKYALGGFKVPDYSIRELLVKNLLEADVVGIPEARYPTYQRLFNNVAKEYKLPINDMCLTNSQINYRINEETTCIHQLLSNYKVLLIGNRANDGKEFLLKQGYQSVVGAIAVPGIHSVEQVLEEVKKYEFDVALVSAGIPANLICVEIAKQNKVAIDFGHLLDWYINGRRVLKKV